MSGHPTALLTAGLLAAGCAAKTTGEAAEEAATTEIQPRTAELMSNGQLEERIDLNGDGRFDVTSICYPAQRETSSADEGDAPPSGRSLTCRFEAIMVRKEMDLNWDGKADRIRYYEDGELHKIANDSDFDGHFECTASSEQHLRMALDRWVARELVE